MSDIDYDDGRPICKHCLDETMDETDKGYECKHCGAGMIWHEESGKWIEYDTREARWHKVMKLFHDDD